MAASDERFVFDPILERDGVTVSHSPWGPDDEIGRLNWITPVVELRSSLRAH